MTAMISRLVNHLPFALGFVLLLFATTSGAAPPPAGPYLATPIPPGMARIWFYRDLNPNDIMAQAYIRLNGAAAGVSEPGGAFYRDVPPGRYHIHVDSYVDDRHNDGDVALAPGAEAYAKVLPLENYVQGGGGDAGGGYRRNSFVVWLYPPEAARPAVARSFFQASGS